MTFAKPETAFAAEAEKRLLRSAGGKYRVAAKLLPLIPDHHCYVEPFAGGAAVFFAKERSGREVLNDKNADVAFAYRFAQRLTSKKMEKLKTLPWTNRREIFESLRDRKPSGDLERFHRLMYLSRFGYFGISTERASFNPAIDGEVFTNFNRFTKAKERLKGVTILSQDYEGVVRRFDGTDTFFFFDPPYPGHRNSLGDGDFDEERFVTVLEEIKGQFLITYGEADQLDRFAGFQMKRITVKTGTPSGLKERPLMLITNRTDLDGFSPIRASVRGSEKKRLFASSGGKRNVVARLLPLVPAHKTYVEPFAGGAALFFAKPPSDIEVLNDADPEIAFAYRFVQSLDDKKMAHLRRFSWVSSRERFAEVKDRKPRSDAERFYRFIYLNRFGYFSKPGAKATYAPDTLGNEITSFTRFERGKERLKAVHILAQDYAEVVRRHDAPDTFFFFDPPFPNYTQDLGEENFDEEKFTRTLRSIKGKFLVTYGVRSDPDLFEGFRTRRIVVTTSTPSGPKKRPLLLVSNYEMKQDLGPDFEDVDGLVPIEGATLEDFRRARQLSAAFAAVADRLAEQQSLSALAEEHEALADLPVLARQLRDVLGATGDDVVATASALDLGRELGELLPRIAEALRRSEFTGARRIVLRMLAVLNVLDAGDRDPETSAASSTAGIDTKRPEIEPMRQDSRVIRAVVADVSQGNAEAPTCLVALGPIGEDERGRWRECVKLERGLYVPIGTVSLEKFEGKVGAVVVIECDGLRLRRRGRQDELVCTDAAIIKHLTSDERPNSTGDVLEMLSPEEETSLYKRFIDPAQCILKRGSDEERFTLGEVLVPDEVDAQADVYTKEEVRRACHRFSEFYLNAGFMHKEIVNGKVVILETYVLPCDWTTPDGRLVKEGTWVQGRGYRDDRLWNMVKAGELTGLSIGGSAVRKPIDAEAEKLLRTWQQMVA